MSSTNTSEGSTMYEKGEQLVNDAGEAISSAAESVGLKETQAHKAGRETAEAVTDTANKAGKAVSDTAESAGQAASDAYDGAVQGSK